MAPLSSICRLQRIETKVNYLEQLDKVSSWWYVLFLAITIVMYVFPAPTKHLLWSSRQCTFISHYLFRVMFPSAKRLALTKVRLILWLMLGEGAYQLC